MLQLNNFFRSSRYALTMKLSTPKQIYKFDRPREKLKQKGVTALTNFELFQALIGSGVKGANVSEIARELERIWQNPSIELPELLSIKGLNLAKAAVIVAALELVTRRLNSPRNISSVADILPFVNEYASKRQEHLVVLSLDGARNLIQKRVVTIGTLNNTLIHPREVFADAISDRAAAIILVHNHPSNTPEPSKEDLRVTEILVQAGNLLGIRVDDHVIITPGGKYFSFAEQQLL